MPTYKAKYNIDSKPLGTGGAAIVYGCTRIADGERFAIKILKDQTDKDKVARFNRDDIISGSVKGFISLAETLDEPPAELI